LSFKIGINFLVLSLDWFSQGLLYRKDEEVQNRNSRQKNIHTSQRENLENHLIEQEGDVQINETENQRSEPIMDNIQTEKRIKVNRMISGFQKGSGET
jgi:hypothetical protein